MANQEHLDILQQGVRVWNKWRVANPGITPNLSRTDLSGANTHDACLPLWCGGTNMTLEGMLSYQLVYHAFQQNHKDKALVVALEHLRPFAEKFRQDYRPDAFALRGKPTTTKPKRDERGRFAKG